jgi:hypothetical protein
MNNPAAEQRVSPSALNAPRGRELPGEIKSLKFNALKFIQAGSAMALLYYISIVSIAAISIE